MVSIPTSIEDKTRAALHGDTAAMGTLFQWYRPRLYAHALRICGNTPLAEDAVQETFISSFTHYDSLKDASLFYPWMKKILFNHCFRMLSKEKSSYTHERKLSKEANIIQTIEEHFDRSANIQWVHEAMNQLSDELKSCVLLRYFSNFKSYDEIALILGIPIGTVRSRLSAAKEKLLSRYNQVNDSNDLALKESKKWTDYYTYAWQNLYYDSRERNKYIEHMIPSLRIRFTSGKEAIGRQILEEEVHQDLNYGSVFRAQEIMSSGNISVVEGGNINAPEYYDRCPASSVFVIFRRDNKIESFHIFDSPRRTS